MKANTQESMQYCKQGRKPESKKAAGNKTTKKKANKKES